MTRELMGVCEDSENEENCQKRFILMKLRKTWWYHPSAFLAGKLNCVFEYVDKVLNGGIC